MPFDKLDQTKIDKTTSELDALGVGKWGRVPGIYIFGEVNARPNDIVIMPWGLIVLHFQNTTTGEIKTFPARLFE